MTFVVPKMKALSTIIRLFKKFHLSCKNLDDQARLEKPKT